MAMQTETPTPSIRQTTAGGKPKRDGNNKTLARGRSAGGSPDFHRCERTVDLETWLTERFGLEAAGGGSAVPELIPANDNGGVVARIGRYLRSLDPAEWIKDWRGLLAQPQRLAA